MKRKFLLLVMMCLFGGFGFSAMKAQNVVTIDGSKDNFEETTNDNYPFNTNYKYTTSQQFYRAHELGNMKNGDIITSIAFKIKASKISPLNFTRTLKIYMINTEEYKFESKYPKLMNETNDLVFSGNVTFDGTGKWFTIDISKSGFKYTGDNILICVVDGTNYDWNQNTSFYAFKAKETDGTTITRGIYKRDTKLHDPTLEATTNTQFSTGSNINQIQFTYKSGGSSAPTAPMHAYQCTDRS